MGESPAAAAYNDDDDDDDDDDGGNKVECCALFQSVGIRAKIGLDTGGLRSHHRATRCQ